MTTAHNSATILLKAKEIWQAVKMAWKEFFWENLNIIRYYWRLCEIVVFMHGRCFNSYTNSTPWIMIIFRANTLIADKNSSSVNQVFWYPKMLQFL